MHTADCVCRRNTYGNDDPKDNHTLTLILTLTQTLLLYIMLRCDDVCYMLIHTAYTTVYHMCES